MTRNKATRWSRYHIVRTLWREVRVAWALLRDPRVPLWTKALIPGFWLAYFLFPLDLLPDVIPVLGEVDDLMLFLLMVRLFIAMSPADVVREVEQRVRGVTSNREEKVVEGKFWIIE